MVCECSSNDAIEALVLSAMCAAVSDDEVRSPPTDRCDAAGPVMMGDYEYVVHWVAEEPPIGDDGIVVRWIAEEPHVDGDDVVGAAGDADFTPVVHWATEVPDVLTEPMAFAGVMRKRCTGMWRHSTTRHFVLKAGCLIWSAEVLPLDRPADVQARSCVDLSRTECEASVGADGRVALRPLPGRKWHRGDAHSRAGTAAPILLDFKGASADVWAERLQRHIDFGRALRRCHLALRAEARLAALGLEDCDGAGATCAVCLEEVGATGAVRTPCGHDFHRGCVRRWAENMSSCPLCRTDLGQAGCPCETTVQL